jgi:hypothetical protein
VVLNPNSSCAEKEQWQQLLEQWSSNQVCPLEDADSRNMITHIGANNLGNVVFFSCRLCNFSFLLFLYLYVIPTL